MSPKSSNVTKLSDSGKSKKSEPKPLEPLLEANLDALESALASGTPFKPVTARTAKDVIWPAGHEPGAQLTGMLRGFVRRGMTTIAVFATRNGSVDAKGNRSFTTALKNAGGAGHFFQLTYKGELPDGKPGKNGTPRKGGPDIQVAVI